jgi:predicted permease
MSGLLRFIRKAFRKLYFTLHERRMLADLAEEMDAHREMMAPEERLRFGNMALLREESSEIWSWVWLQQLRQDLAYGVRSLRNAPAFTLGATVVLSLGVGANLAEFQVFDAIIFHRLNIRDANAVLQISRVAKQGERFSFPPAAIQTYATQSRSFAWLVSEGMSSDVTVDADTGLRPVLVSANYFTSLGIVPSWGRLLDARDSLPGAPAVAVLGYDYWFVHYAADPHVVGRTVHVNNHPVEIVGVLPYTFDGLAPRRSAIWLPLAGRATIFPGSPPVQQDFARASEAVFGKLKPGVSKSAGEAELTSLTRDLARHQPNSFHEDERIQTQLMQEAFFHNARGGNPAIFVLITMMLLVLFSACANLGNMLLARGFARQREITIRKAIGASSQRLVRQLMTESALLAILGTVAGVGVGAVSARLFVNAMIARTDLNLSIGWPICIAGFLLILLSTLAFGLPAALQVVRSNQRRSRLQQILVGLQVSVSCLLLIASAVLVHTGILSASPDLAFDYRNMVVIYPQFYSQNLPEPIVQQKLDALTTRFSGLPGVNGVTRAIVPPLGGRAIIDSLPGLPHIYRNAVAPSYFGVMNLALVQGRTFQPAEQDGVIVSESAARAVWPNESPLGKVWALAGLQRTVVGVVKDSGANLLADPESIEAYVPVGGAQLDRSAVILHVMGDPCPVLRLVAGAAASSNETVSASLMRTSRDTYLKSMEKLTILLGGIGLIATSLAAIGMFALVAFTVAQRKRELGIRIAIGARPPHILRILLTENAKPMIIGAVSGAILAAALSRLERSMVILPRHETIDVPGFALGIACFALVAVLATLSPALRALRIDPSETLREE